MIFHDFFPTIRLRLTVQKQEELLAKIKKPHHYDIKKSVDKHIRDANDNLEEADKIFAQNDTARIIDVKIAEDGSPRMYLVNHHEPVRTYPDQISINVTTYYKKFVYIILKNVSSQNWFKKIISILFFTFNFESFNEWIKVLFDNNACLLKEEHYSQPIKEVRRVLKGRIGENIVDAISLILECDMAYRYRFQDVIVNYDRTKGIMGEITKLLDILYDREREDYESMKLKWSKLKLVLRVGLIINPKFRKLLKEIFDDINLDEVKFSKEDTYWINQNGSYFYKGLPVKERLEENKVIYGG